MWYEEQGSGLLRLLPTEAYISGVGVRRHCGTGNNNNFGLVSQTCGLLLHAVYDFLEQGPNSDDSYHFARGVMVPLWTSTRLR
jgi:hypothetical protein